MHLFTKSIFAAPGKLFKFLTLKIHIMGRVIEVWLSCYLVLLSVDSKPADKTVEPPWPDPYHHSYWWPGSVWGQDINRHGIDHLFLEYFKPCMGQVHSHLIVLLNTLRPRQNGRHFADDIFKCIFLNENVSITIKISLKFVPKGPINNIPALVQIMIIWTNDGQFTNAYMRHSASMS